MARCRVCGCTHEEACYCEQPHRTGVCYWFEGDLCSACANLPLEDSFQWERWDTGIDLEREEPASILGPTPEQIMLVAKRGLARRPHLHKDGGRYE